MKVLLSTLAVVLLAGCASGSSSSGQSLDDLRKPLFFKVERTIPLTFPEIQMALIRHQRLCGTAPVFTMNEGQTAYGTLVQQANPGDSIDQAILVDLTWLQPSWRQEETRVKAEVFSRYSGRAVDERIQQIFATLSNPDSCSSDVPEGQVN